MKELFIGNLPAEGEVTDFFMVKDVAVKLGANKKQYLDVLLGDKTGEVSCKKWDLTDDESKEFSALKKDDIVKIRGNITQWNGTKQLRIMRLRLVEEKDIQKLEDYIKAAPYDPTEMYEYILGVAKNLGDKDLAKLTEKILTERKEKLMYYPAAQKNHHAEMAGLLYHMMTMLKAGEKLCQVYEKLNKDLLLAGVILHDIEKLTEIEANLYGISSGYSFEGQLLGHIIQGIKVLDKEMEQLGFDEEKKIMVEHMLLSHHYEPEYGSPKKPLFPEAEMLHYLDIIDARMFDMFDVLDKTPEGEFAERQWVLENRKLYKPKGGTNNG